HRRHVRLLVVQPKRKRAAEPDHDGTASTCRAVLYDNTTISPEPAQMATNPHEPRQQSDLSASWQRFDAAALQGFAEALLRRSGLRTEQAEPTARILLEADLMGHTTHGLQLLAPYLRDIEAGRMCIAG